MTLENSHKKCVSKNSKRDVETRPRESVGESGSLVEKEIGGRDGPDPVRYGDWEKNGRCIDF